MSETWYVASTLHRRRFAAIRACLRGAFANPISVNLVLTKPTATEKVTTPKSHPHSKSQSKLMSIGQSIGRAIGWLIVVLGLGVGGFVALPAVYFHFFPAEPVIVVPEASGTPLGGQFTIGSDRQNLSYVPPQDNTLPIGQWIVIPRIGVRTELQNTPQAEEALSTGVWMVPGYGTPGDLSKPMILAAHRYGWKWWWENEYWKYHSFYLLPDLEPGDTVEIIADQRKWVYEIYAGEEGEDITDYQADLILYTCKFLNSPLRHFRYARLIDPTRNTQS